MGLPRHEIDIHAVDGRLIHGLEHRIRVRHEIIAPDTPGLVNRAEPGRHRLGQRHFVLLAAGELVEAEGQRAQRRAIEFGGECGDRSRIDSGGEKDPHRDVRHEMLPDRIDHQVVKVRRRPPPRLGSVTQGLADIEKRLRRAGTASVDPEGRTRRQGADAIEQGEGVRDMAPKEEPDMTRRAGRRIDPRAGPQRLDGRSQAQGPAVIGEIELLDAERIARQQHALAGRIPDGEGIHAAQMRDHGGPVAVIEMQQHLGVRLGAQLTTLGHQLRAQLPKIVDLAVEGDDRPIRAQDHRLMTGRRRVDDRQAPMPQSDAPRETEPLPGIVQAPRHHRVADPQQLAPVDRRRALHITQNRIDAAHEFVRTGPEIDCLARAPGATHSARSRARAVPMGCNPRRPRG
jgi:hypothetical protein